MRKSDIVGRWIDIPLAIRKYAAYYSEEEDHDDEEEYEEEGEQEGENLEIFVEFAHSAGYDAFSVLLELSGPQVRSVKRIGHVHMCGGQGCDDELYRFPLRYMHGGRRRPNHRHIMHGPRDGRTPAGSMAKEGAEKEGAEEEKLLAIQPCSGRCSCAFLPCEVHGPSRDSPTSCPESYLRVKNTGKEQRYTHHVHLGATAPGPRSEISRPFAASVANAGR